MPKITKYCYECGEEFQTYDIDDNKCEYCRPCVLCGKTECDKTYEHWGTADSYSGFICTDCMRYLEAKK
jgi:hypothetical protein